MDTEGEYSLRVLQVAEVLSGEDSESYAQYLMQVLKTVEGGDTGRKVIREVVEYALTYIRTGALHGAINVTRSPAIFSLVPGRWCCRRTIDSLDRGKRSHGSYFPLDRRRVGMRV